MGLWGVFTIQTIIDPIKGAAPSLQVSKYQDNSDAFTVLCSVVHRTLPLIVCTYLKAFLARLLSPALTNLIFPSTYYFFSLSLFLLHTSSQATFCIAAFKLESPHP